MVTLPSYLIAPVRSALQAQGFPASVVKDNGEFDLLAGATRWYDTVEVRTSVTPPYKLRLDQVGGKPSPVLRALQPTIILSGKAGRMVVAPAGEAGDGTVPFVLGLGGIVAGIVLLTRL